MTVADPAGHVPAGGVTHDGVLQDGDLSVQHAHVHFHAQPRSLAMIQRAGDTDHREQSARNVADGSSRFGRRIAGLPGISLPCGFATAADGARLPIGVQILAKPFDEASLFRAAFAYEQSTDWHKQFPPL